MFIKSLSGNYPRISYKKLSRMVSRSNVDYGDDSASVDISVLSRVGSYEDSTQDRKGGLKREEGSNMEGSSYGNGNDLPDFAQQQKSNAKTTSTIDFDV